MTTAKKTAPKTAAAKKAAAKKPVAKKAVAKKDSPVDEVDDLDIVDIEIDDVELDDIDIDDIEIDIDIDDIEIDDLEIEVEALVPGISDDMVSEDALDDAEELSDEDDLDGLLQAEDGADDADVVRERAANTALVAGFDDERVPVKPRAGTVDDEDDEIDLAVVVERQSYEFVCQSCFLVMRRTQIGQSAPVELCKDCC